jgi:type IV pilus assembly protein PilN
MRFDINLASQPYEDVQRFLSRWRLILLGVALLTAVLAYAARAAYVSWRISEKQTSELRAQVEERAREKAAIEAALNRSENSQLRSRAQFLNTLIARKAFSWTEVFSDLEKLVPPALHVSSIHPDINEDNQLEVKIVVAGSNRDGGVELVRRLENSSHFMHARIDTEAANRPQERIGAGPASQPAEVVQFQISAIYIPPFARTPGKSGLPAVAMEASNGGH